MKLCLQDGTTAAGRAFGAPVEARGEVVFHTGMVGYVEALTDPSYRGQILVLTYPLIGNYGVPADGMESDRIQVQGLIVSRYAKTYSHHAAVRSLGDWLTASGVPAIEGVDTRLLVQKLRSHGTMQGALLVSERDPQTGLQDAPGIAMRDAVSLVSPSSIVELPGGSGPTILVIDTGVKESIVRSLQVRGAKVIRAGASTDWEPYLARVDGVLLGNGPGDPRDQGPLIERLRKILDLRLPTFGICLGHQLLGRCLGADTFKLPFGHRSHNQPVLEVGTRRAFITSQNHGYAVDERTLPADVRPWFVNLNDGTNEGIRHASLPFSSVQFHPEAAAGPRDTAVLFDEFLRTVSACQRTRS
ncbi:MAG: glutamine-hydrolyzing carbamoyl-phosphate synthase small subunit [Myxococcales bacterium]|nr:glutamine-hydrolyzing carbamoyl-phosphate synthase small subunit [Myxococcales bacterium]